VAARTQIPATSWYALAVLIAVNFMGYMDRMALSILQEPIKADLHLSDKQLGLLSGLAFAAFYSTLGIPLARLADRFSRVKLISICLALWSVMTTLSGMTRTFLQLFLARMGVGVGEAGCLAPAHSLISDYFPRERRALAICIFQCGAVAGMSAGLFIVGTLGQHLGWRASLQIAGIMGVPVALLAILTLREPARPPWADGAKEPALQAIGALFRRPALVHLGLAYALSQVCSAGISQWEPSFLVRSFGMSMAQVGAWLGLSSAVSGILGLLTGGVAATWLVRRDPRWELWIPAIALGASTPLFVWMALSPTAWMALVLKGCASYLGAISGGVALAAIQSFAEPHRRATAVSLVIFTSSLLGTGVGPVVIGTLSDLLAPSFGRESLRYALLISCVMLVWSVVHFLLSGRRTLKDRVN
jgi:MFS family permease